ncbi:MAG: hypothetical protein EOL97_11535 [Spirochaetia bacterium]|nr:hypothetical protein [Spirochaetia bacterium]
MKRINLFKLNVFYILILCCLALIILNSCSLFQNYFFKESMVVFSQNPGLYQNGTQLFIEFSTDNPSDTIYYTTDGSEPTSGSNKYKTPIAINTDTTLRAKSYNGFASSLENKGKYKFVDSFPNYNIGEEGPSGGTIFYDKGNYTDGWRYLEAAPRENEGEDITWENSTWGNYKIAETSKEIGDGLSNTLTILDNLIADKEVNAASYCWNLEIEKDGIIFDDWFLPSVYELEEIWNVLNYQYPTYSSTEEIDYPALYWSSSNHATESAWGILFLNDEVLSSTERIGYTQKNQKNKLRAIRML